MFRSTVSPPQLRQIKPYDQFLTDPVTGAPIGIRNPNANGEDGQFYPIPVTAAQILAPDAAMLADTSVTYQLNVAPYTRYRSDGDAIVPVGGVSSAGSFVTVPAGTAALTVGGTNQASSIFTFYQSLTIQNTGGVTFQSPAQVVGWP